MIKKRKEYGYCPCILRMICLYASPHASLENTEELERNGAGNTTSKRKYGGKDHLQEETQIG